MNNLKDAVINDLQLKINNHSDEELMVKYWSSIIEKLKKVDSEGDVMKIIYKELFYGDDDARSVFKKYLKDMKKQINEIKTKKMKNQINEVKRMQVLAGIITENQMSNDLIDIVKEESGKFIDRNVDEFEFIADHENDDNWEIEGDTFTLSETLSVIVKRKEDKDLEEDLEDDDVFYEKVKVNGLILYIII
jgi:hypothetical protein